MKKEDIEVTACLITFNHEKYVAKAIEGMLHQKTKFKYEILVHDDASTDETVNIIKDYCKKYPGKIRTIFQKKNQFSQGLDKIILYFMLPEIRGKYMAFCEGDDFWSDENKLQKQYEAMQNKPDYSVCAHRTNVINENGSLTGRTIPFRFKLPFSLDGDEYIRFVLKNDNHLFHTSSLFVRTACMKEIAGNLPEFMKISKIEDRIILLYLGTKGNIFYIDESMSNYRIMSEGSWSSKMTGSHEFYYKNTLDIIKMLESYGKFTGGKFAVEVEECLTKYYFRQFQYEVNAKEMLKQRYAACFQQLTIKDKIYYTVCAYIPFAGKFYQKVKGKFGSRRS